MKQQLQTLLATLNAQPTPTDPEAWEYRQELITAIEEYLAFFFS